MEVTALKSRAGKEITMSTTKPLAMLTMAVLIVACGSTAALAQRGATLRTTTVHDHRGEKPSGTTTPGGTRVPPRRPVPNSSGPYVPTFPGSSDEGAMSFSEASQLFSRYREWKIGPGKFVPPSDWIFASDYKSTSKESYNLKGTRINRYFQFEQSGARGGVDLG